MWAQDCRRVEVPPSWNHVNMLGHRVLTGCRIWRRALMRHCEMPIFEMHGKQLLLKSLLHQKRCPHTKPHQVNLGAWGTVLSIDQLKVSNLPLASNQVSRRISWQRHGPLRAVILGNETPSSHPGGRNWKPPRRQRNWCCICIKLTRCHR